MSLLRPALKFYPKVLAKTLIITILLLNNATFFGRYDSLIDYDDYYPPLNCSRSN